MATSRDLQVLDEIWDRLVSQLGYRKMASLSSMALEVTSGPITLYVDATKGSDANEGLTASTPLLTITAALNKLPQTIRHTPTINVAAGTYTEKVMIPPAILMTSVLINGEAMAPTAPAAGLASGTFDASFGTQLFPNIATVAAGGWTADALVGFFVQMTSGSKIGTRLPIISNTATTLTLGLYVNTAAYQGQTFTLVKPVVFLNNSVNEAVSAWGVSGGSTNGIAVGTPNYFTFTNFQFTRSSNQAIFRGSGYSAVMFANCSFLESGSGGAFMNRFSSVARFDDCLFFKNISNNTSFNQVAAGATGVYNRCVFGGGNNQISQGGMSVLVLSSGFFLNSGLAALQVLGSPGNTLAGASFYNCAQGIGVANSASFQITNMIIKNCTTGLSLGYQLSSASGYCTPANIIAFGLQIDGCGTGIAMGAGAVFSPAVGSLLTVKNCTAFGVNLGHAPASSHNLYSHFTSFISMTGNTADFSLDGTTGISLATLQAAPGKAIVDATRFNRIIEA